MPATSNLKCDPDLALDLRDRYEQVRPGYHMNKKHWNTVEIDEPDSGGGTAQDDRSFLRSGSAEFAENDPIETPVAVVYDRRMEAGTMNRGLPDRILEFPFRITPLSVPRHSEAVVLSAV